MKRLSILVVAVLMSAASSVSAVEPIKIVAAENFYGDVARQIGGSDVSVTSILNNPNDDPHLFEASPSVARAIAAARIVIYSGIDYDPWVEKLLSAAHSSDRKAIVVADLVGKKTGDNPHIWYDTGTMLIFAKTLADDLGTIDPGNRTQYQQRLARFQQSMKPIQAKIAALRARLARTPVTATEPVFGYMFDALGMQVRNLSFQLSVMNNTEPSASDVAAFENDLKAHRVKLLIYNSQASDPSVARMVNLAKASRIPVVGATETKPAGKTYQQWIAAELDDVARALAK